MSAVEVWLAGGPAGGRIQLVERDWRGHLPELVILPQAGMFVGSTDEPLPTVEHRYRRDGDIDGRLVYRYEGGRDGGASA